MSTMRLNVGFKLTYDNEIGAGSLRFHLPSKTSGITIGAGYDLLHKDAEQVIEDFESIGFFNEENNHKKVILKQAIGLTGTEAKNFILNYGESIELTSDQQLSLFKICIVKYKSKTISDYEDMFESYYHPKFYELPTEIKDLMVDYCYNLGSIKTFPKFFKALLTGDRKGALKNYKRFTGGIPLGRRNDDTLKILNNMVFKEYVSK